MTGTRTAVVVGLAALAGLALRLCGPVFGEGRPDPAAVLKAQREAMVPLAFMDGEWRGEASTVLPSGEKRKVTQTERIGPFLDGSVKVIEGRGYDADGTTAFNALGIVSYDPSAGAYTLHSHAEGSVGDFPVTRSADGLTWEIPAGPATIRFTSVVKGGTWHEVGERVVSGQNPVRFFEMTLQRIGDTTWPAGGAVPPK